MVTSAWASDPKKEEKKERVVTSAKEGELTGKKKDCQPALLVLPL